MSSTDASIVNAIIGAVCVILGAVQLVAAQRSRPRLFRVLRYGIMGNAFLVVGAANLILARVIPGGESLGRTLQLGFGCLVVAAGLFMALDLHELAREHEQKSRGIGVDSAASIAAGQAVSPPTVAAALQEEAGTVAALPTVQADNAGPPAVQTLGQGRN